MTSDPLAKEIQQFEQQVRRDPNGRAFARLADAYRKDGQLERALELLEGGLARHADYLSAHLVHGRTLRSLGRPLEAAEAFKRVTELDAANVIALRALAEMAEEAGESERALTYVESLLQILPQDDTLEQQAERLRRASGAGEPDRQAEPATTRSKSDSPWLMPDSEEEEAEADSEVAGENEPWLVLADEPDALDEFVAAADDEEPAAAESGDFVLELADEDVEPADFVFDLPADDEEEEEPGEFTLELPEPESEDAGQDFLLSLDALMSDSNEQDVVTAGESSGGDDQDNWRSGLALIEDELDAIVLPELEDLTEPSGDSPANPLEGWLVDEGTVDELDAAEDVPGDGDLLTRTMADLYAAQGQPERAAEIYTELLKDLPQDEELQAALEELQSRTRPAPAEIAEPDADNETAADIETAADAEPRADSEPLDPISPAVPTAPSEAERSGTSEFFQEWLRSLED
ncbi:MAG: tetratricopeptide repeat protein [Gemmatimonadota bacterium]